MMNEKIKLKAKIKDSILKVKFMIVHPMLTEKQSLQDGVKQDYITYILIKVGTRILYEFKTSSTIKENSILKFKVQQKELKVGNVIKIEWRTLLGATEYYDSEIK